MQLRSNYITLTAALFLLLAFPCSLIAQEDSVKKQPVVNVAYYMENNNAVYVLANAKIKIDGKFQPVKGINISLYLEEESPDNLLGSSTTDKLGLVKAVIPPAMKPIWDSSNIHTFLAVSDPNDEFESASSEVIVTKSKIYIDTSSENEIRSISVTVVYFNGTDWVPAPDVEMRVGVRRSGGGLLKAGEDETYMTDSSGIVMLDYVLDSLPGDENGILTLMAKVEENELYGNIMVEKTVPWGIAFLENEKLADQRTLWSTRFKAPYWLLIMAYGIILGAWGTLIYLVFQLIKIKRLGTKEIHQ